MRRLMALVAPRRLDLTPLVTHRFALERSREAFELFSHQRDQVMKVAIFPHGQPATVRRVARSRRRRVLVMPGPGWELLPFGCRHGSAAAGSVPARGGLPSPAVQTARRRGRSLGDIRRGAAGRGHRIAVSRKALCGGEFSAVRRRLSPRRGENRRKNRTSEGQTAAQRLLRRVQASILAAWQRPTLPETEGDVMVPVNREDTRLAGYHRASCRPVDVELSVPGQGRACPGHRGASDPPRSGSPPRSPDRVQRA